MTATYVAPGWYADPANPGQERYWNGGSWQPGSRPASAGAVEFPDQSTPAAVQVAEVAAGGTAFEQRVLDLVTKQVAAQERATAYLGWLLALMVALIAVGIIAGVLAR